MVMLGLWEFRSDVKESGFVDIARTDDVDGTRELSSLTTRGQMGHVFAGVTRAGAASRRPYEGKCQTKSKKQMQIPHP